MGPRLTILLGWSVSLSLAMLVCGCGPTAGGASGASSAASFLSPPSAVPSGTGRAGPSAPSGAADAPQAGGCHARGSGLEVLPDPSCTPGATNPAVTQADTGRTICRRGWTSTVRPPESYTEPLKYEQMAAYGDKGPAGAFEEDHLIPLELGGSPDSPRNLWPEPGPSPNPKDSVERAANRAVCAGSLALSAAQQAMAADWISFGRHLGILPPPSAVPPTSAVPPPSAGPAPSGGTCQASASYNSRYADWDVYVHSDQPDRTVQVMTSGGATASYHTDGSGYADVYLHAPPGAAGQRVTVTVGSATCVTTL